MKLGAFYLLNTWVQQACYGVKMRLFTTLFIFSSYNSSWSISGMVSFSDTGVFVSFPHTGVPWTISPHRLWIVAVCCWLLAGDAWQAKSSPEVLHMTSHWIRVNGGCRERGLHSITPEKSPPPTLSKPEHKWGGCSSHTDFYTSTPFPLPVLTSSFLIFVHFTCNLICHILLTDIINWEVSPGLIQVNRNLPLSEKGRDKMR